nr:phosphorylated CTD-interacting factor 1-like [Salvelinus alpinus]
MLPRWRGQVTPAWATGSARDACRRRPPRVVLTASRGPRLRFGIPVTPTTPTVPVSPITPRAKPWNSTTGTEDKPGQPASALYRPTIIYWDLYIQTNAVIRERAPANHLPPHPEIELQRAQLTTKLRQHYQELCYQREDSNLSTMAKTREESFNRWPPTAQRL